MACYHPLTLYRQKDGRLAGVKPAGQVPRPQVVQCNNCIGCQLEHSRQWAVRCVHEAKTHEANCFVTLTFNDAHLPDDRSLDVTHWQKFAKRLRNARGPFRFFHCGEYGDEGRAHYHALLFGIDFSADQKFYKNTKQGDPLYTSPSLEAIWGQGYCPIGQLTFKSAAYVARYSLKKQRGRSRDYELVDPTTGEVTPLKRPYATMSRRPGIGRAWLDKYFTDVYPSDEVISDGHAARPPAYYDTVLELRDPELHEEIKNKRVANAMKHATNNTPKRLTVRETIKKSQISTLGRHENV